MIHMKLDDFRGIEQNGGEFWVSDQHVVEESA